VTHSFDRRVKSAIREALAREAYEKGIVNIADAAIAGYQWLVASRRGLFAVSPDGAKPLIHGWFFGICRHGDDIYCFENCGLRNHDVNWGRVIRLSLNNGRLGDATVLATGLSNRCHQLAVIDGLLCVVDTANQRILRFTLAGEMVDAQQPFPAASQEDSSGAYLHINAVRKVGERIGLMLHNGKAEPEKASELAWLDANWKLLERVPLDGYGCHDIVEDSQAILWHSASMSGEIFTSDGRRFRVTDDLMTRGIAQSQDHIIVGVSTFGPRQKRDALPGTVHIFDRQMNYLTQVAIDGAPTDIICL
jgi:hypothetical protein